MKLSDEQILDALRDAGHEEAATALEQKLTAEAAVAAGPDGTSADPAPPSTTSEPEVFGFQRMARGYAQIADAAQRGGQP